MSVEQKYEVVLLLQSTATASLRDPTLINTSKRREKKCPENTRM